jgi:hypothetical protein
MNGKLFVIATLFAVILLTVAYVPIASREAQPYDPWADYNSDGKIDITDVANIAARFGTAGDPTRNVTITGHATKVIIAANGVMVGAPGDWNSGWITVDGYSKVTININFRTPSNTYDLYAMSPSGGMSFLVDKVTNFNFELVKTYDVMNQQIYVYLLNTGTSSASLYVQIYLMA